jgi:hypothetical protein
MGGAHFCARLSAFKMLNPFFCNSIDPSPGLIARPEISKFAEIFGQDCKIPVTLYRFQNAAFFIYLYVYRGKLDY